MSVTENKPTSRRRIALPSEAALESTTRSLSCLQRGHFIGAIPGGRVRITRYWLGVNRREARRAAYLPRQKRSKMALSRSSGVVRPWI